MSHVRAGHPQGRPEGTAAAGSERPAGPGARGGDGANSPAVPASSSPVGTGPVPGRPERRRRPPPERSTARPWASPRSKMAAPRPSRPRRPPSFPPSPSPSRQPRPPPSPRDAAPLTRRQARTGSRATAAAAAPPGAAVPRCAALRRDGRERSAPARLGSAVLGAGRGLEWAWLRHRTAVGGACGRRSARACRRRAAQRACVLLAGGGPRCR